MRHTLIERTKSIAGAAFIGLGAFVLYENLDRAAGQLSDLFAIPEKTFGILPAVILAALRGLESYAFDHQRFLLSLFRHALATLWPLLLVIAGTALSRDAYPADAAAHTKKDGRIVDLTAGRSTFNQKLSQNENNKETIRCNS
jgi:hypothetical protein